METTRLSSKGQVVLPSAIRQARAWKAGTVFSVTETSEGVLLQAIDSPSPFKPTRLEDVFGKSSYKGPPLSIEEMDAAIEAEGKRRAPKRRAK